MKNLGFRCDLPLTNWDVDVIYHKHMVFRSDLYCVEVGKWAELTVDFLKINIPTYLVDIPLG